MTVLCLPVKPTLFHTEFWASSRPAVVVVELGLVSAQCPVDLVTITREQLKGDPMLVKLNPQKRLPFFFDPAKDLKLNESGGLVQYLLEEYDTKKELYPPPGHPTRAEFLKLVHFGPATCYHLAVPIIFHTSPTRGREATPEKMYLQKKEEWKSFVIPTIEHALDKFGGPFLLGPKFSGADIVCGYDLMMVAVTDSKELIDSFSKVKAYFDLISQREAYKTIYSTNVVA